MKLEIFCRCSLFPSCIIYYILYNILYYILHIILQHCPQTSSFYTHLPAYEDGTDRVFRNVGIQTSDAVESPKRKHTTK